jgi:signal transduction histidine kinase
MLRIAQETVNNALHHAQATHIAVTLRDAPEGLEMLVEDDGRGFEMHDPADRAAIHFGLAMLQERARRIRAAIQVRSELGVGTRLRLLLPTCEVSRE